MPLPDDILNGVRSAINQAEKAIPEVEKDLRDARRAGIDTTDQTRRLSEARTKLGKLKAVYGLKQNAVKRSTTP
tara:strand:+ start:807 stop:1028 length:222 start_codon:yes stop_codon:yes gene_type:complete